MKTRRSLLIASPFLLLSATSASTYAAALQKKPGGPIEDAAAIESKSGAVANDPELGEILRTPIARFANLQNYAFKANYVDVGKAGPLKMHFIDEGPRNGRIVLLMHGNPSWVYDFREMVPGLVNAGYRVIAPDLIGFGKSDKPSDRKAYTYDRQVEWTARFLQKLRLTNIYMHCQDWGGLIGLRLAVLHEPRFKMVAVSNTFLPEGDRVSEGFLQWRTASQSVPTYGSVMEQGTFTELTPEEEAAYDAPFPDEKYKAAPREMPLLVPIATTDPEAAENSALWKRLERWEKPFLTIFGSSDSVIPAGEQQRLIARIPGAQGQNHQVVPNTGHFISEDVPALLVQYLNPFFQ